MESRSAREDPADLPALHEAIAAKRQLIDHIAHEVVAEIERAIPVIVSRIVRIEQANRAFFQSVRSGVISQTVGIGVGELHDDSSGGLADQAHLKGVVIGGSFRDVFIERSIVVVHARQYRLHSATNDGIESPKLAARQIPVRERRDTRGTRWSRASVKESAERAYSATGGNRSASDRRVQVLLAEQMHPARTDIPNAQDSPSAKISLNVQVPLLLVGRLSCIVWHSVTQAGASDAVVGEIIRRARGRARLAVAALEAPSRKRSGRSYLPQQEIDDS